MEPTRRVEAIDEALRVLLDPTVDDLVRLLVDVQPSDAELDAAETLLLADAAWAD